MKTVTATKETRKNITTKREALYELSYEHRNNDAKITGITRDQLSGMTTITYTYIEYALEDFPDAVGTFQIEIDLAKALDLYDDLQFDIYAAMPDEAQQALHNQLIDIIWRDIAVEWPKTPLRLKLSTLARSPNNRGRD